MRQAARSILIAVVALLGVAAVAVSGTVTAAVMLAAKAIVVPGTGTPDANVVPNYLENFVDYYMGDTFCDESEACTGDDLVGVNYPASFWPLFIFPGWCEPDRCEKWNVSVGDGVAGLNAELINTWQEEPDAEIVIAGYSQGGAVVSNELRNLAKLTPEQKERLEVVMIGNIANPDGGLWQRLSPLNLVGELLLDATLGPPMITDSGIRVTNIGYEYDPVVYAPRYWGNPFAILNALVAFDTVHGQYLAGPNRPEAGELPYGYQPDEVEELLEYARENCGEPGSNCRLDANGNKYIMIPAKSLPLADAVLSLGASVGLTPVVKPLVDLFAPVVKVLVDLGYDWSGDPGVPRTLSLLPFNPFNNWFEVGLKLIEATGEGVEAFLENFGITSGAPVVTNHTPAPAPTADSTQADLMRAASVGADPMRAVKPAPEAAERVPVAESEPDEQGESPSGNAERTTAPRLRLVTERDTATAPTTGTGPATQTEPETPDTPAEPTPEPVADTGTTPDRLIGVGAQDPGTGPATKDAPATKNAPATKDAKPALKAPVTKKPVMKDRTPADRKGQSTRAGKGLDRAA